MTTKTADPKAAPEVCIACCSEKELKQAFRNEASLYFTCDACCQRSQEMRRRTAREWFEFGDLREEKDDES